jgi:hypothetical protein
MGNRLAVRVSCDDTPIFFVSALLLVDGQPAPYPSLAVRARNGRVADDTVACSLLNLQDE